MSESDLKVVLLADIAIFYETSEGHTAEIANRMKGFLENKGLSVSVQRCREADTAAISAAKVVIIGGSVHAGSHQKQMMSFIKSNSAILTQKPGAFFSVNLYSRSEKDERKAEVQGYLDAPEKETDWKPSIKRTFPGALPYTKYNFVIRWMMKWISSGEGGDTDTSRDFVYTDWAEVETFCSEVADLESSTNLL